MSANAEVLQGSVLIGSPAQETALPQVLVLGQPDWNPESFAREQIRGLVRRVFFSRREQPINQVVFSAAEPHLDVASICDQVAQALALETSAHVAIADRGHGMGIVVEYAGHQGKPVWLPPKPFHWSYVRFGKRGSSASVPGETLDMTFAKDNAAEEGFNRWTINGAAYPMSQGIVPASFHLKQDKRYRLRMRNASDDIHPIHLHRHSFELTKLAGVPTAGVMKDVVMVGGYQEVEVDFTADNPGLTLFHCHQQLHMDFGFMTLFDYL